MSPRLNVGCLRRRRRRSAGQNAGLSGQTLIEFALVLPAFLSFAFGLLSFGYLSFQQQAVNNAARQAAREAALLSTLFESGDSGCASGYGEPTASQSAPAKTIEAAATAASSLVSVNTSLLCATSATATTMTSSATQSGKATITVTGSPSLAAPTSITVTVSYTAHPLSPFITAAAINISASSTEPVQ